MTPPLPVARPAFPLEVETGRASACPAAVIEFVPVSDWILDAVDEGQANTALDNLFRQNGYEARSIILNLASIMSIFLLLLIFLLYGFLKDMGRTKLGQIPTPNGRTEVRYMSNTTKAINTFVRFMLLTFFEVFVCLLVNFKSVSKILHFSL